MAEERRSSTPQNECNFGTLDRGTYGTLQFSSLKSTSSSTHQRSAQKRTIHIHKSQSMAIPVVHESSQSEQDKNQNLMSNVKQKLSDYGAGIFQGIAMPLFFHKPDRPRSRSNSRTRNRSRNRTPPNGNLINERLSDDDDYVHVENIELHHMDGFILSTQKELGKGHSFYPTHLASPTWCDKCGDFIWGAYKHCLRCRYCNYTCHHQCRPRIILDCISLNPEWKKQQKRETSMDRDGSIASSEDSGYHTMYTERHTKPPGEYTLTREDLRKSIQAFNGNHQGLIMTLDQHSNTFQGFIRVHMNLIRPINMSLSLKAPSLEPHDENLSPENTRIASFYLPKDTTKVIHIESVTSTQEVITALLSKFRITDNPRKFALYEKTEISDRKANMRKIIEDENPLQLCLGWSLEENGLNTHKFVLQENDSGDIVWDAFSVPELENFLVMLAKEEQEYMENLRAKYQLMKIHMVRRMKELKNKQALAKESTEKTKVGDSDDKREPVFV